MSKVSLYEPAMCCDTGVCGPGVDTELLRVSSIIQTLEKADGVEDEGIKQMTEEKRALARLAGILGAFLAAKLLND